MGRSERRQGASWEQEVRKDMDLIFGHGNAKRRAQTAFYNGVEPDVETPELAIECKSGDTFRWISAVVQSEERCPKGLIPVVAARLITKGLKPRRLAVVPWSYLIALLAKTKGITIEPEKEEVHGMSAQEAH